MEYRYAGLCNDKDISRYRKWLKIETDNKTGIQRTAPQSKPPSQIAYDSFFPRHPPLPSILLLLPTARKGRRCAHMSPYIPILQWSLAPPIPHQSHTRLLKFVVPWRIKKFYCPLLTQKKPLCFSFSPFASFVPR